MLIVTGKEVGQCLLFGSSYLLKGLKWQEMSKCIKTILTDSYEGWYNSAIKSFKSGAVLYGDLLTV